MTKLNIKDNYISQTELLKYFEIEPKTKVYFQALSKLAKLRNGFLHRQKYKDGRVEKFFEPQLTLNKDFVNINNRPFYNENSISKIKSLMTYYIQNVAEQKEYLARQKKEKLIKKNYGKEYKKIS